MTPPGQEPRVWALRLTARARADIAAAREFIAGLAGESVADAWEEGIEEAMASLKG